MTVCNQCGFEYNENYNFCPNCSAKNDSKNEKNCPYCGTKISNNQKFCHECGAKVIADKENYKKVDNFDKKEITLKIIKRSISLTIIALTFLFAFLPLFSFVLKSGVISLKENYSILNFINQVDDLVKDLTTSEEARAIAHWSIFGKIAMIVSFVGICGIFIVGVTLFVVPFISKKRKYDFENILFKLAIASFVIYFGAYAYLFNYVFADPNVFGKEANGIMFEVRISSSMIIYLVLIILLILIALIIRFKDYKPSIKNIFSVISLVCILVGLILIGNSLFKVKSELISMGETNKATSYFGAGNLFQVDINSFASELYWYLSYSTIIGYCAMIYLLINTLLDNSQSKVVRWSIIGLFTSMIIVNFVCTIIAGFDYSNYVFDILRSSISTDLFELNVIHSYGSSLFISLAMNVIGVILLLFSYKNPKSRKALTTL